MSTKDYLEKDYYKVLGVPKDAKPEQIKKAFRKIARDNHPDAHPGDKQAEERFKQASEANDVLSDPAKRQEYDETRSLSASGFRFPGGSAGGGPSVNVNDLFRTMAGGRASGGEGGIGDILGGLGGLFNQGGGSARRVQPRKGADVEGQANISFMDSIEGTTVRLRLASDDACPACHGTGARSGTRSRPCSACQGSGHAAGGSTCLICHGRGVLVDDPCPTCHGSGHSQSGRTLQVRIPAGVSDGQRIRVRGKGAPGSHGGASGDLYVRVQVQPDKIFGRTGDNVTVTVPVTFPEAALGTEVDVPTLDGSTVRLKVAAGTPNGRKLRVRGKGITKSSGKQGDLLATIEVVVPTNLSDEAVRALRAYEKLAAQPDPRADISSAKQDNESGENDSAGGVA